jgi:hypothetical protein
VAAKASYYRTRTAYTVMTNRESTDEEEESDKEQDSDGTETSGNDSDENETLGDDTDSDGLQEAQESPKQESDSVGFVSFAASSPLMYSFSTLGKHLND